MVNYYQVLNLPDTITQEELALEFEQFKEELKKFSPGIEINENELRSRKPNEWDAFSILINPLKRKEHDELLERDRIHRAYEEQNRIQTEEETKASVKWKYIGLSASSLIVVIYFLFGQSLSYDPPDKPNWRRYYVNDEVNIMLPSKPDTLPNLIPPYLTNYINKSVSFRSELASGFCVTIALIYMNEHFKISLKDLKYITSMESQNPHLRSVSNIGEEINGSYKGYKMTIAKKSYQIDNVIRTSENYTFLKGLTAIKIIVNYNPGDQLQEKYNEIIFKSIN